jgi:hypothetical protein
LVVVHIFSSLGLMGRSIVSHHLEKTSKVLGTR